MRALSPKTQWLSQLSIYMWHHQNLTSGMRRQCFQLVQLANVCKRRRNDSSVCDFFPHQMGIGLK